MDSQRENNGGRGPGMLVSLPTECIPTKVTASPARDGQVDDTSNQPSSAVESASDASPPSFLQRRQRQRARSAPLAVPSPAATVTERSAATATAVADPAPVARPALVTHPIPVPAKKRTKRVRFAGDFPKLSPKERVNPPAESVNAPAETPQTTTSWQRWSIKDQNLAPMGGITCGFTDRMLAMMGIKKQPQEPQEPENPPPPPPTPEPDPIKPQTPRSRPINIPGWKPPRNNALGLEVQLGDGQGALDMTETEYNNAVDYGLNPGFDMRRSRPGVARRLGGAASSAHSSHVNHAIDCRKRDVGPLMNPNPAFFPGMPVGLGQNDRAYWAWLSKNHWLKEDGKVMRPYEHEWYMAQIAREGEIAEAGSDEAEAGPSQQRDLGRDRASDEIARDKEKEAAEAASDYHTEASAPQHGGKGKERASPGIAREEEAEASSDDEAEAGPSQRGSKGKGKPRSRSATQFSVLERSMALD